MLFSCDLHIHYGYVLLKRIYIPGHDNLQTDRFPFMRGLLHMWFICSNNHTGQMIFVPCAWGGASFQGVEIGPRVFRVLVR